MRTEVIRIGDVDITVTFKAIKNLHLSVHPPYGRVTIASPEFYDLEKIKIYAATKWAWIKSEQRKFASQAREKERKFITQESHYFLGKRYLLKVLSAKKNGVYKKANKLELQVIDTEDVELKRRVLYRFYKKELQKRVDDFIKQYAKIIGLTIPQYGIRVMKTKWGSCALNTNRLWFNIELAKKPLDCIEYIVVHELVHLLEKNHNKNFILLMDKYLANWRVQKKMLNELPL
ncbi:MAG TPA: SprT family zinc-dependent metalloprotease [Sphingobacteriaceae bacterium]